MALKYKDSKVSRCLSGDNERSSGLHFFPGNEYYVFVGVASMFISNLGSRTSANERSE